MTGVIVDHEAEEAVLGAVLLSPKVLPVLAVDEHLTPEDFGSPANGDIWRSMLALHDRGEPVDALTVSREAGLDQAKVEVYAATVPAAGNARHYARIVKRAAQRRRWQHASYLLAQAAQEDSDELAAQAEAALMVPEAGEDTYSPERLANEAWQYLAGSDEQGISTGFRQLDEIIGDHP